MSAYQNVCHNVVALASDRTNADPVSTEAVHIRHGDVVSARDGNAIILIQNCRVSDDGVVA